MSRTLDDLLNDQPDAAPSTVAPRIGPYDDLIQKHAQANNVDPDLVHRVMGVESTYKPNATSPKNAQGLMQLIPATAARFGVKNSYDPDQNISGGTKYLKWLLDRYQGDPQKAVAAYNCFDASTEILTGMGWKFFGDIAATDTVGTLNPDLEIEYLIPEKLHAYPFAGNMVRFKSRGLDAMVTPNHRMLARMGKSTSPYQFVEASQMENQWRAYVPVSGVNLKPDYDISDDLIQIVAWALTDSSINYSARAWRVLLYQRISKAHLILEILHRLGWTYSRRDVQHRVTAIAGKVLKSQPEPIAHIRLTAESRDKLFALLTRKDRLPEWVFDLSARQFRLFMESVVDANGSRHLRSKNWHQISGRLAIMDDLQRLSVVNDCRTKMVGPKGAVWSKLNVTFNTSSLTVKDSSISEVPYDGMVYCVTTANATVVTRRNGCVLITGNSGEGAVDKYHGIPPFRETQKYVPSVLKGYTGNGYYPAKQSVNQTDSSPTLDDLLSDDSSKNVQNAQQIKSANLQIYPGDANPTQNGTPNPPQPAFTDERSMRQYMVSNGIPRTYENLSRLRSTQADPGDVGEFGGQPNQQVSGSFAGDAPVQSEQPDQPIDGYNTVRPRTVTPPFNERDFRQYLVSANIPRTQANLTSLRPAYQQMQMGDNSGTDKLLSLSAQQSNSTPRTQQAPQITGNDLQWHLGMSPSTFRQLPPSRQAAVIHAVAQNVQRDARLRAQGQDVPQPTANDQNALRAKFGLEPGGNGGQANRTDMSNPFSMVMGGAGGTGESILSSPSNIMRAIGTIAKTSPYPETTATLSALEGAGQGTATFLDKAAGAGDVMKYAPFGGNQIARLIPGIANQQDQAIAGARTAANKIRQGVQFSESTHAPESQAGEFGQSIARGVGNLAVELPQLVAGGEALGAANLPVQGALSRTQEGVPGVIKGALGGLVYHYGMGVTGKMLGKVGNALVWTALPAAEGYGQGESLGKAIGGALPMGALAGMGGSEPVEVREGNTTRPAMVDDLKDITSKKLEVVPPARPDPTGRINDIADSLNQSTPQGVKVVKNAKSNARSLDTDGAGLAAGNGSDNRGGVDSAEGLRPLETVNGRPDVTNPDSSRPIPAVPGVAPEVVASSRQDEEPVTPEIMGKPYSIDDEPPITYQGKSMRPTVTVAREDDGQYSIKRIKLHDDASGQYQQFNASEDGTKRFNTPEEAEQFAVAQTRKVLGDKLPDRKEPLALSDSTEPEHYSSRQPRDEGGKFTGPPEEPSKTLDDLLNEPEGESNAITEGHESSRATSELPRPAERSVVPEDSGEARGRGGAAPASSDSSGTGGQVEEAQPVSQPEKTLDDLLSEKPVETPEPPSTSARNAQMAEDRKALDLPELPDAERKKWTTTVSNAQDKGLSKGADSLVESLIKKPRPLDDEETAGLALRGMELKNQHSTLLDQIDKSNDPLEIARLNIEKDDVQQKFDKLSQALHSTGTESGRGLAARKLTIDEDFSQVRGMQIAKANRGEAVPKDVEAKIADLSKQIKEAQDEVERQKAEVAKRDEELAKRKPSRPTKVDYKSKLEAESQALKLQLTAKRGSLDLPKSQVAVPSGERGAIGSNIAELPGDAELLAKYAAGRLTKVKDTESLNREMVDTFGAEVEPHLSQIRQRAYAIYNDARLAEMRTADPERKKTLLGEIRQEITQNERASRKADLSNRQGQVVEAEGRLKEARAQEDADRAAIAKEARERLKVSKQAGADAEKDAAKGYKDWVAEQTKVHREQRTIEQLESAEKSDPDSKTTNDLRRQVAKILKNRGEDVAMPPVTENEQATSLRKSIDRLDKQIADGKQGNFDTKEAKPEVSDKIKALQTERDMLSGQLNDLKRANTPKIPSDPLKAVKTRLAERAGELEHNLRTGQDMRKAKSKLVYDEEAQSAQIKVDRLKREWKAYLDSQKPKGIGDYLSAWQRMMMLSGYHVIGKLTSAATLRTGITGVEDVMGAGLSKVPGLRDIAAKAPREGGFSTQSQIEGMKQFASKMTAQDMIDKLKNGSASYERKAGYPGHDTEMMGIFGRIHGALKVPAARAEFYRGLEKRTRAALDNGENVTSLPARTKLISEAFADSQRAILMQDNMAVSAYRGLTSVLRNKGPAGKVTARVLDTLFPIVKVGSNYAWETGSYLPGGGLAKGTARILASNIKDAGTVKAGMSKILAGKAAEAMTPADADYVMSAFKKQGMGAGLLALGFALPTAFGGFYDPDDKPNPRGLQPGDASIWGIRVPHLLLHNPALEMLQVGATIRRVMSRYNLANKAGGMTAAAGVAGKGLAEQIPFYAELVQGMRATEGGSNLQKFAANYAKTFIEPGLMQNIAGDTDKDVNGNYVSRKTKTFGDVLKAGVPGLRETLPNREGALRAPIATNNKVANELDRLKIGPIDTSQRLKVYEDDEKQSNLSDDQKGMLAGMGNAHLQAELEKRMTRDDYAKMPDAEKAKALKDVIKSVKADSADEFKETMKQRRMLRPGAMQ